MRFQILLFAIFSILCYGFWLGYHYLRALGSGYANTLPSLGPDHLGPVLIGVGVLGIACLLTAAWAPWRTAWVLALMPVVLIGFAQAYLDMTASRNFRAYEQIQAAAKATREVRLSRIQRDFVLLPAESTRPLPFRASFLTVDIPRQLLFRIDVGHAAGLTVVCLGRLEDDRLELYVTEESLPPAFYGQYQDAQGRTIFQRYALRYGSQSGPQDCHFK